MGQVRGPVQPEEGVRLVGGKLDQRAVPPHIAQAGQRVPGVDQRRHHREVESIRWFRDSRGAGEQPQAIGRAGSCAESAGPAGEAQVTSGSPERQGRLSCYSYVRMDPTASPASPPPKASPIHRHWFLAIAGLFVLVLVLLPLLQWRQISSQALREILRAEMTRVSDSVYVLQISPVRLRLFPGSISFDSAYVTTDTIRKAAYPNRPVLRLGAHDCQFSGVDIWKLLRKQGLYGSLFRCSDIRIGARVASTDSIETAAASPRNKGLDFLTLQREFKLPAELPVISIERVAFPDIRLDLTRQRADLPTQRVALQKFSASFEDVVIDPQIPASRAPPALQQADRARGGGTRHRVGRRERQLQAHGGRPGRGQLHPAWGSASSPPTARARGSGASPTAGPGSCSRPTASGSRASISPS